MRAAQIQKYSKITRLPLNKIGAFAEYAAVNEDALSIMPENLSFIEAAAAPLLP